MNILVLLLAFFFFILTYGMLFQIKSYLIKDNKVRIKSWYKEEDGKIRWNILYTVGSTLIGLISLLTFCIYIFYTKKIQINDSQTTLAEWGQFGDFIGGFVGIFFTIVGVILLYETLSLQRKELKEGRSVFEKQRFEDTFFKMLSVYQDILKDMTVTDEVGNESSGKDYFKDQKNQLLSAFPQVYNIYQANKDAIIAYEHFYILNKDHIAHYYRTLYRIFKLIDDSNFESEEKMKYAKIVRALLSESELFFLNYNAQTEYGSNFKQLINDYNLTKHLPILEKLEFKWLAEQFDLDMRMSMSQIFFEIKRNCIEILPLHKIKVVKKYFQGNVDLTVEKRPSELRIRLFIRKSPEINNKFQKGYGLLNLDEHLLREMLSNLLHEIVEFQNFNELNLEKLKYNKYLRLKESTALIWANVKTENSKQLRINDDKH